MEELFNGLSIRLLIAVGGQTFKVGDAGYVATALQKATEPNVNLSVADNGVSTLMVATIDNVLYGTFISVENPRLGTETYFSFLGANNGSDHVKFLVNHAIGFESLPGFGDVDDDDTVVAFEVM